MVCTVFILTGTLCGCGAKVYEERMETTKEYYDYIDRINQNLGPQFADSGVSLRIPKQFQLIPAPVKKPKPVPKGGHAATAPPAAAAVETEKVKDPRQPDFLDIELPGLIAAWQAELNTVNGTGEGAQSTTRPGSVYLLSNYTFWQTYKTQRETINPIKFHEEIMRTLEEGLGVRIDERTRGSETDRVNKWFSETVPDAKDELFAPKKEVRAITLVPEEGSSKEDFIREYQVYLFANGDMKIVLIYALPRNVSAGEDIQDRILFSLQTLNVSAEKPVGAKGKGAKTAKPGSAF